MDPNNPSQNNVQPQNSGNPPPPPPSNPPPSNSNLMSPIKRQGIEFYRKLPFRLVVIGISVLIILFGIFVGSAAAVVYGNAPIPFLKDKRPELIVMFYRIPLIPKSPEMILVTAIKSGDELKTFYTDFSLNIDIQSEETEPISLELFFEGPLDVRDKENISFDISGNISIDAEPLISDSIKGEVRQVGKETYLKANDMPDIFFTLLRQNKTNLSPEAQKNLEDVYSYWVKYETQLDSELQEPSTENIEEDNPFQGVDREDLLSEIQLLEDEEIEGVDTYHLSIQPSKEILQTIASNYTPDEINKQQNDVFDSMLSGINDFSLDLWVGKSDSFVRKFVINANASISNPTLSPAQSQSIEIIGGSNITAASSYDLSLSSTSVTKNINQEVNIEKPIKVVGLEEYLIKFGEALSIDAEEESTQLAQYNRDLNSIRTGLQRYYAAEAEYPIMLGELVEVGYIRGELEGRLSTYSYRINRDRNHFILYVDSPPEISNQAEYYGITSPKPAPGPLTEQDFNLNN